MRLVIYFGLMILALIGSVYFGQLQFKRTQKYWNSYLIAFFVTVVILGVGSIWWFYTETYGISQGLGVIYYCVAAGVIAIIDMLVLSFINGRYK